jgi:cold shock CspA family protein
MTGTIVTVVESRGYGFISRPDDRDLFFHMRALVAPLEFNEQLLEQRVEYDVERCDKGWRAVNVRAAK